MQLNMRQSKVAKSFEAQRKNGDENEAVTQREAENQRCGPRVPNNYATRSQSRFNVRLLSLTNYYLAPELAGDPWIADPGGGLTDDPRASQRPRG